MSKEKESSTSTTNATSTAIMDTLCMIRDRLDNNDKRRVAVQEELNCKCQSAKKSVNEMRDRLQQELNNATEKESSVLLDLASEGNSFLTQEGGPSREEARAFLKRTNEALHTAQICKVVEVSLQEANGDTGNVLSLEVCPQSWTASYPFLMNKRSLTNCCFSL